MSINQQINQAPITYTFNHNTYTFDPNLYNPKILPENVIKTINGILEKHFSNKPIPKGALLTSTQVVDLDKLLRENDQTISNINSEISKIIT